MHRSRRSNPAPSTIFIEGKKMRPYKIKKIKIITYSGRRFVVEVVEDKILNTPIRIVKEKILDAFSMMKDAPVRVKLSIKYI